MIPNNRNRFYTIFWGWLDSIDDWATVYFCFKSFRIF